MKPAVKFLFDTSFDVESAAAKPRVAPDAAAKPEPGPSEQPKAPPPPSYSEAELAAAQAEAYARGRGDGEAAAQQSLARTNGEVLTAIQAALPGLAQQIEEGMASARRHMLETTLAGLRRLMPELNRRGGLAEIEGLLKETLGHIPDESRILVRLNDALLDGLRGDIEPMAQAAGFEGKLVLLAEDDIAPGDCRIEWADGGVDRVGARIWADIEAAVTRAIAAIAPAPGPAGATPARPANSVNTDPAAGAPAGTPQET